MIDTIVSDILKENKIEERSIDHIKSGGSEHVYFVNNEYVVRITDRSITNLIHCLEQISFMQSVQKIAATGFHDSEVTYNYIICNKIPGVDYIDTVVTMTDRQNADLGICISGFLDSLHSISGTHYDIGHYIPIIPNYMGSWKEGHRQYWEYMRKTLDKIEISNGNLKVISKAFEYFESNEEALDYEHGPVLLHNDLHPKNIIVEDGAFSGVIDWECSQYGEPDFELCHFVHWCLYPPRPEIDLRSFLYSLLKNSQCCLRTDNFSVRQTIYQLEHEIMQIIWSKGKVQDERTPRIKNWLDGQVQTLLNELT